MAELFGADRRITLKLDAGADLSVEFFLEELDAATGVWSAYDFTDWPEANLLLVFSDNATPTATDHARVACIFSDVASAGKIKATALWSALSAMHGAVQTHGELGLWGTDGAGERRLIKPGNWVVRPVAY